MRDGARTRERILSQALGLFAGRGVDGTSVRDIAQAVGVAEGALYRHFRSKDEIVRTLFVTRYAALAAEVVAIGAQPQPFPLRMEALIARFAALFDGDPDLFVFLLVNQHQHLAGVSEAPEENPVAALAHVMEAAMMAGDLPRGDADLAAALALGIVVQTAQFCLYGRLAGPLSARVPVLTRAAIAALAATRPAA